LFFSVLLVCSVLLFFGKDAKADVSDSTVFVTSANQSTFSSQEIKLDNVTLDVKIADTPAKMEQGLQYSDPLPYTEGMLFIPPSPEVLAMWMPNMKFSLDMIWFDSDGNVLHIEKNVPPCTSLDQSTCPIYNRTGPPSQYALEVTSGFVDKYNITMNSKLTLSVQGDSNSSAPVDQSMTLTTDKEAYLPGDTVQLSGMVAGQPNILIALQIKDSSGNIILIRTVQSDSNGNFAIQFKIPPTATSGNFSIVASSKINGSIVTQTKTMTATVPEFGTLTMTLFGISFIMISIMSIFLRKFRNYQ